MVETDFLIENGVLKKYTGKSVAVKVPEGVRAIGENAFNYQNVEKVELPADLEEIGQAAFGYCEKLKEISVPESVKTIGFGAFWDCKELQQIRLSNRVTSIGLDAFHGCKKLTITADIRINDLLIWRWNPEERPIKWIRADNQEGLKAEFDIENGVLKGYRGKGGVVEIPRGVKTIAKRAFYENSEIKAVYLPESLGSIEEEAFWGCDGLTKLVIPDGVTAIGKSAFGYCENMEWIILPQSVKQIGTDAFRFCRNLKIYAESKKKPAGWGKLFGGSFNPDKRPVQWDYKHADPWGKEFDVKEGVLRRYRGKAEIVEVPYGVAKVGAGAFKNNRELLRVIFPNTVTEIADEAFIGCDGLQSIVYAERLQRIGSGAFSGCKELETFVIPRSVENVGEGVVAYCDSLSKIVVEKGNQKYYSQDNCLIEKNTKTLLVGCRESKLPSDLEKIGVAAFKGCDGLTELVIPNGVAEIEGSAFLDCRNLKSVYFSGEESEVKLSSIGVAAFKNCEKLTWFKLPDSIHHI